MSTEQSVMTVLNAHVGLTALVSSRFWPLKLRQNAAYPNIVYQVERDIINTLSGESSIKHEDYQFDVRGETYDETRAAVIQLRAAMDQGSNNFKAICELDEDVQFEDAVQTFRTVVRYSVWQ